MAGGKPDPNLPEEKRKGVYREVWKLQSSLSPDEPDYEEKIQKAYAVVAIRYSLDEDDVRQICVEEAKKKWPPEE
jgi:hypothetical protein